MGIPVRNKLGTVFAILLAILAIGSARIYAGVNVWTSHGPEGGYVNGPPVIDPQDPNTLYVTGPFTLFKSTDAASSWSALTPARIVAVDPQNSSTLYGTSSHGEFIKSTNGGVSWNAASPPPGSPQDFVWLLVIDPRDSGVLYAVNQTGLFKSTDGAASWSAAGSGLPDHRPDGSQYFALNSLVMDPVKPNTLYVVSNLPIGYGGGVFKSTDGAANWSEADSGLTGTLNLHSLTIDPKNPNTLYLSGHRSDPEYRGYTSIGGYAPTLFKSKDAGSSWTMVNGEFAPEGLSIDPQDTSVLYAPGPSGNPSEHGVFKSMDGGATWSAVFSGLEANWVVVAPGEQHSSVYAGIGGFGIFKSTDGGTTWATANSGLKATNISAVSIDPRNPGTVYAGVNGAGIFKSVDSGNTWNWSGLYENGIVSLMPSQDPNTLYAMSYAIAFKSTDEGRNWSQLNIGRILAVDPQDPNTIYGAGGIKSTDGGVSWVKLALPQPVWISALGIDPQDRSRLYAGAVQDKTLRIFRSLDGGVSWTSTTLRSSVGSQPYDSFYMERLVVDPKNPGTVYAMAGCDDYDGCSLGLPNYKSTDGGATWARWYLPEDGEYLAIDPQGTNLTIDSQGAIYVVTNTGLFKSADSGASWSVVTNAGLPSGITALAIDPQNPNHLFAGTYGGVFEITLAHSE